MEASLGPIKGERKDIYRACQKLYQLPHFVFRTTPCLALLPPFYLFYYYYFLKGTLHIDSNVWPFTMLSLASFFFFLIYFYLKQHKLILFIYFWLRWVFVLLCEGFLQLRRAGATLHRGAWASHCRGLSRCGARAPDAQAQ